MNASESNDVPVRSIKTAGSIRTAGSMTGLPAQSAPAETELGPGIARTRAALSPVDCTVAEKSSPTLPVELYDILKISEIDPKRYDEHPVRHACAERLMNNGFFSDQRTALDFVAVCFKVTRKQRLTTSETDWLNKLEEKFVADRAALQAASRVGYHTNVLRRALEECKKWSAAVSNAEAQLGVYTAGLKEPLEFYLNQIVSYDGIMSRMPSAENCAARLHNAQLGIAFLNEKILPVLRRNSAAAEKSHARLLAEAAADGEGGS